MSLTLLIVSIIMHLSWNTILTFYSLCLHSCHPQRNRGAPPTEQRGPAEDVWTAVQHDAEGLECYEIDVSLVFSIEDFT